MKAKEYAKMFTDAVATKDPDSIKTCIAEIGNGFLAEISQIAKTRNASGEALPRILLELNDKWQALVSKLDGALRPEGFYALCAKAFDAWPDMVQYLLTTKDKDMVLAGWKTATGGNYEADIEATKKLLEMSKVLGEPIMTAEQKPGEKDD